MKIRTILIIFALLAFLTASIEGYLYYYSMKESAVRELSKETDAKIDEITNRLGLYLSDYQKIAATLAGIREMRKALASDRPDTLQDANAVLDHFQRTLEVDICYLIDRSGTTIASSNRNTSESLIGKNFAFRPYFKLAIGGAPCIYPALGVFTGKRGVFYSHPVYVKGRATPAGVVVIKESIAVVEKEIFEKFDGELVLVDPQGVIFASTLPEWLYHILWKTPPNVLSEIGASQQFGIGPLRWIGMERLDDKHAVDLNGNRYMVYYALIKNLPGWKIMYLPQEDLFSQKVSGVKFKNVGFIIMMGCVIVGLISIILYVQANHEIKKRKLIEEELRGSNDRLYALIKASPLPITIIDLTGTCLLWNPAAEQVFGWAAQEVIDNPLRIIPADRQEEYKKFLKMNFEGHAFKSAETQRLRRDGTLVDIALSTAPLRNSEGVITAAVGIYEDITERKKTENEIQILAAIIQNLPEAVCAIDLDGNVVAWNSSAERLLGYMADEIMGKPITNVIPEDIAEEELSHCLTLLNTDGYFSGYESVRLAKDGKKIPVELTAVAIKDSAQNVKNYASIMVDLTDRKKVEEERLKVHMLESIGILAGGIAHDFNNLLNVIVGNVAVAKMSVQPGDKVYSRLEDAENVCGIAAELSKRLITFATGGEPLKKPASLSELFKSMVDLTLKDSIIKTEIIMPEDLYLVAMDEGQMRQVVNNLINNAKEAMPQGGTLTVRGENLHITAQDNVPMREGDYLKISIHDTGAGIPSERLAKIFDPYYSTKDTYSQKGLGLGLAVCYSVVNRHGGLITVDSQPGEGTTFNIFLNAVKNG
jgi:PAS domain S-box-containing protein